MPDWYLDRPEDLPTYDFWMQSFWMLATCRQIGMGLGPIPWNHIKDFADRKGLDAENADVFVEVIMRMDAAYIDHMAEQQPKPSQIEPPRPEAIDAERG